MSDNKEPSEAPLKRDQDCRGTMNGSHNWNVLPDEDGVYRCASCLCSTEE